ncbi:TPA: hypothetical protein N2B65_006527 [Pseudomonas aeruginosa]|uniref:hypothetical protein n=1 Tax=Pseudomonas putida TaxID=303 RepID=UPI0012BCC260|nr:hypothetical protein [Pseudomonas putida]HCL3968800.1 hypothetical protein [Pseudomonas aeruginosa]
MRYAVMVAVGRTTDERIPISEADFPGRGRQAEPQSSHAAKKDCPVSGFGADSKKNGLAWRRIHDLRFAGYQGT